ncbi:hypothetical protein Droror1_Dr00028212 [Drosera rotundifolia]
MEIYRERARMREFREELPWALLRSSGFGNRGSTELGRFLSAYSREIVLVVKGLSSSGIQVVADSNLWSSIVPGVLLAVWSSFEYVLVLVRIRSPRLGVKGVLLRFSRVFCS